MIWQRGIPTRDAVEQFLKETNAQQGNAQAHAVEGDVPLENMLAFIDVLQAQPGYQRSARAGGTKPRA